MQRQLICILMFLPISVFADNNNVRNHCGIDLNEFEGIALAWYGYREFEYENAIAEDEAFVWEYSTNEYCGTQEYDDTLGSKFEESGTMIPTSRKTGFKDVCQYRAIESNEKSPFKFKTKFQRRLYTTKIDGNIFTWFVVKDKAAIKIDTKTSSYECLEYGI